MSLSLEQIERLHSQGRMPDWIYYQVNGKSLQENFSSQMEKGQREYFDLMERKREQYQREKEDAQRLKQLREQLQAEAIEELERQLPDKLEEALDEMFSKL